MTASEAYSLLDHCVVNILETSALESQDSIDLLLASALKVFDGEVKLQFSFVSLGTLAVSKFHTDKVSRADIPFDGLNSIHEKKRWINIQKEGVVLVKNAFLSKIQSLNLNDEKKIHLMLILIIHVVFDIFKNFAAVVPIL